jgi:hypothetical protein
MKAQWNCEDYLRMMRGQLQFTEADSELIHDGPAARAFHRALPTMIATLAPQ